jgi:hypothetical protein
VREGVVRLAPHCYSSGEDIGRAMAALAG